MTKKTAVLELATAIDQQLAETLKILREHPDEEDPERLEALEKYAEMEGYTLEAKAKKTLSGLSFHVDDFNKPAKTLSGGWVMRAHPCSLASHGTRLIDAGRTDQPSGPRNSRMVSGANAKVSRFSTNNLP